MGTALTQTRISTASLGKFQAMLKTDKPLTDHIQTGKKRKLPCNDSSIEGIKRDKKQALEILGKMKKSDMDYESAVNKQIRMDNIE